MNAHVNDSYEAELITNLAEDIQGSPLFYNNPGIPYTSSRDDLFSLLVVNVLSAQAPWSSAVRTSAYLTNNKVYAGGNADGVLFAMLATGYRSSNNTRKAEYIIENHKRFMEPNNPSFQILFDEAIRGIAEVITSPLERRDLLTDNHKGVKGFGLKIASHFLRGVGLDGGQLAILDTHLLKALRGWPALRLVPDGLDTGMSNNRYREIEDRLLKACRRLHVRINDVDRYLWRFGSLKASG